MVLGAVRIHDIFVPRFLDLGACLYLMAAELGCFASHIVWSHEVDCPWGGAAHDLSY